MKEKIKLGIIGLGNRGKNMSRNIFGDMRDVEITMVCDMVSEKVKDTQKYFEEEKGISVKGTTDWHEVINCEEIDAVVVLAAWAVHVEIAVAAMRAGKYAAIEVGGAYDISDCFRLVDAHEETGMHCMMLENCCYGRPEMMALRMVKEGLFGEVVHCTGAYMHDLRSTDLSGTSKEWGRLNTYRIEEYAARNCDNYPTHALGPICKVLNINRGNRMLYLTSMASKAAGVKDYWERHKDDGNPMYGTEIKQGDIVVTNIMCVNGETIMLRLDTTLPRAYYSRDFSVRGTRGAYDEARKVVFLDGMEEEIKDNQDEFFEKYDHPIHAEYVKKGEKAGHGGMDWLVGRAFVESVKRGIPTPIDTYDTAAWMAITPLSEQSIATGGAPVQIPDFTRGKWIRREAPIETKYSLDVIVEDKDTPIY
ncbi:MAG: gfo/Idh/MocA family oxidoreductase [Ruminococcaceae bacterium]|nr:gfo/Idh/MocA family oxidoreductase [Oscillospiraceae bacterium]